MRVHEDSSIESKHTTLRNTTIIRKDRKRKSDHSTDSEILKRKKLISSSCSKRENKRKKIN